MQIPTITMYKGESEIIVNLSDKSEYKAMGFSEQKEAKKEAPKPVQKKKA